MKILKWLVLGAIVNGSIAFSFGAGHTQEPMNLGEFEITGEVRRPNLFLVDSHGADTEALGKIALESLKEFERELLGDNK